MTVQDLERALALGLERGLPGASAHLLMAPAPRPGWEPGRLSTTARTGAALLLLYPRAGEAHVLLTVRDSDLPNHAGQVSLPGGAVEPDETLEAAALREAHEEVGADPTEILTVARLTPLYIPVSRFNVHPVLGIARDRIAWRPDSTEVSRILEVPLSDLTAPERLGWEVRKRPEGRFHVPFYRVEGEKVWGATAMILSELLCLLGHRPDPHMPPAPRLDPTF